MICPLGLRCYMGTAMTHPQRGGGAETREHKHAGNEIRVVQEIQTHLYKRGPPKGEPVLVCRAAVYFHDFRRTAYRNLVRLGVPPKVARLSIGWLNINTADRYDIPDKADLDVLRALYNAAATGRLGANSGANCTISGQESEIHVATDRLKDKTDKGWSSIAPGRIELPTSGLGNRCSIRLSYGAVPAILTICKEYRGRK
jgi:hypothetical protein